MADFPGSDDRGVSLNGTESAAFGANGRAFDASASEVAALFAAEGERAVAYVCTSARPVTFADADDVVLRAFLQVRERWTDARRYSRPAVFAFAILHRTLADRGPGGAGAPDAVAQCTSAAASRADVTRVSALQGALDQLPPQQRQTVVLRELSRFTPAEVGEILQMAEPAVEAARMDALRALIWTLDRGTPGSYQLTPEDFAALAALINRGDRRRSDAQRQFVAALAPTPGSAPSEQYRPGPPAVSAPRNRPTPGQGSPASMPPSSGQFQAPAQPPVSFEPSATQAFSAQQQPTYQQPQYQQPQHPQPQYQQPQPQYQQPQYQQPQPQQPQPQQPQPQYQQPQPQPQYQQPQPQYQPQYQQPQPQYQQQPTYQQSPGTSSSAPAPQVRIDELGEWYPTEADLAAAPRGSTPIFDEISAWFSSAPLGGSSAGSWDDPMVVDLRSGSPAVARASRWEALRDDGWLAANQRAAASPQVAGSTDAGLPRRRPGANQLPSASDSSVRPSMSGREQPAPNPTDVRRRLDGFQQGLRTARQTRSHALEPARERARSHAAGERRSGDDTMEIVFGAFYNGYLPHLLAQLMAQGARPAVAAEVAQDAMAAAYQAWDQISAPEEWTRNWAVNAFTHPSASGTRAWEAPLANGAPVADSGSLFDSGH